jgi:gliding motility-associated-like protein
MINESWSRLVIILTFLVTSNNLFSQTLINTSGNSIQNNSITVEYSIGEISVNTLSDNSNLITQGLLQPIINIRNCNLLQLIPSAFTPNKDHLNDCFGVKNWPVTSSYELNIFNRWGQLIFKTNNIIECWNGEFNGVQQPMGAYVYNIKANTSVCGQIATKGAFILIR